MLEKTFDPQSIESRQYARAETAGAFLAGAGRRPEGQPYTIMMPPPNVTGSLHIGHALTFTIQDLLIRWHRMRGFDVLWQPGTDHAGIATQMVVERELAKDGLSRQQLGREAFLERVWQWKEQSGNAIFAQLKRLGASADWSRERFTMDEGLSNAVRKVFVQLYRQGLIYKDKRLVNWDVAFQTAISDLEVIQKEVKGAYYHIRYPLVDGSGYCVIATTRPETLLGDVAVAVHPQHETYQALIGKMLRLPLTGAMIPVVADEYADPEKGTGAVKITPAHDFNDYKVWKRQVEQGTAGLTHTLHSILDKEGRIVAGDLATPLNIPAALQGLERFEARKRIVALLEEQGLLEKITETTHTVPHGDRSGTVIEPFLTEQWYVDAKVLAEPALAAVRTGATRFVPENWEKTYFQWLDHIEPWCISRQLWWGHRIPAWYDANGKTYVAETEAEARAEAGPNVALTQDPDVLDTWFSSALWPFSTLGWPEETPELNRYYPSAVLVTGFDIIFFWVARMMMMGLHLRGDVPFRDVYIHALVRDKHGHKMSKSKGNVIDPLELIDQYGADALRFTLAIMAAQGRDVKLDPARIEGYRNFATKLWNAARFGEMNGCFDAHPGTAFDPARLTHPVNRWCVAELARCAGAVDAALHAYKFNEAAETLYHFVWGTFCDWYVEFAKPLFSAEAETIAETRATFAWALQQMVALLHPFMPFITDELAEKLGLASGPLTLAPWPALHALADAYADSRRELDLVIATITAIRSARAEVNVPVAAKLAAFVEQTGDAATQHILQRHSALIARMARLAHLAFGTAAPAERALQVVAGGLTLFLPLAGIIDFDAEAARLTKEREKLDKELSSLAGRLSNPGFLAKAPEEVVLEGRQRILELQQKKENLERSLKRLQAAYS